jgi:hypothetical protein
MTSRILSPALSTFARTGKAAGQAMARTFSLISMFFAAIVGARNDGAGDRLRGWCRIQRKMRRSETRIRPV